MGLLKSVGAYGTYRHRYHAATDFSSALELLLRESTFPRSLAHGLQEIGCELGGLSPGTPRYKPLSRRAGRRRWSRRGPRSRPSPTTRSRTSPT